MKHRIARISIHQTAFTLATLNFLLGAVFAILFFLMGTAVPQETGFGTWFLILMPLLYGILGYVFTALGAALYNGVSRMTGGIEFQLMKPDTGGSAL